MAVCSDTGVRASANVPQDRRMLGLQTLLFSGSVVMLVMLVIILRFTVLQYTNFEASPATNIRFLNRPTNNFAYCHGLMSSISDLCIKNNLPSFRGWLNLLDD